MRSVALLAVLLTAAVPAFAAEQAVIHRGLTLRDANKVRLGVIDSVATDGTIGVIVDGTYTRIPGDTVSMIDDKLTTTLTKRDLKKR